MIHCVSHNEFIVKLSASLILIGTGASLMGFYRLQMLEVLILYFKGLLENKHQCYNVTLFNAT